MPLKNKIKSVEMILIFYILSVKEDTAKYGR